MKPGPDADLFRGLLVALPVSVLLWLGLFYVLGWWPF